MKNKRLTIEPGDNPIIAASAIVGFVAVFCATVRDGIGSAILLGVIAGFLCGIASGLLRCIFRKENHQGRSPRAPRERKAPWVLRSCPEGKRQAIVLFFTYFGLLAHLLLFAAGFLGLLTMPIILASQYPDAPMAFPIKWLKAHLSKDAFINVYIVIQCLIIGILTYAVIVYDYIRVHRKRYKDAGVTSL